MISIDFYWLLYWFLYWCLYWFLLIYINFYVHFFCFLLISFRFLYWHLLISIDFQWFILISIFISFAFCWFHSGFYIDFYWFLLISIDVYWCLLMSIYWFIFNYFDFFCANHIAKKTYCNQGGLYASLVHLGESPKRQTDACKQKGVDAKQRSRPTVTHFLFNVEEGKGDNQPFEKLVCEGGEKCTSGGCAKIIFSKTFTSWIGWRKWVWSNCWIGNPSFVPPFFTGKNCCGNFRLNPVFGRELNACGSSFQCAI